MMLRCSISRSAVVVAGVACCVALLDAQSPQGLDPALLVKPPADSWPTYHGDYTGRRHSKLTQITPDNVHQLTVAWTFQTGSARRNQGDADPRQRRHVCDDARQHLGDRRAHRAVRSGATPIRPNQAFHIGHRGAAVYKDTVFLTTPDAHLVALDVKDGKVKWDVVIADAKKGFWSTNAPLLIRNHLIVGVSGDFDNLPGTLKSVDPETGKTQWIFYSTPPPGTPDSISGGATGGQMWMTGTYDPELNLLYVGTGNPTPVLNGPVRPGDNKWICSILAINPDTGKLAWGFQASPHDTHDWDAAEVPVLVDGTFSGAPRKMLMQASRNGYFFVLDRTNGKNLLTEAVRRRELGEGHRRKRAARFPIPHKEPARDGRLVSPNEGGGTNYRSPSFDRRTGLFIVSAQDAYGIYFFKPEHGAYGWAGADYGVCGKGFVARDRLPDRQGQMGARSIGGEGSAGVLTTDTGLTFSGDAANSVFGAAHQRRRDAVALDDRPRRQRSDHLRAGRPAVHGRRRRRRVVRVDAPFKNH